MTQPAARMTITPRVKTITVRTLGEPLPAIHTAHRVGQSSSRVPTGRSSRISWIHGQSFG
jgi:hypothetical protein